MKNIRWRIAQIFENFWWKYYLKGKSPEAYLKWKRDYWNNFLSQISLKKSDLKEPIIDIGCGPAGIFCALENTAVVGLDPLLSSYESLAIFNPKKYKNIEFVESSLEDFSTDKKFQTIFCLNAINHFIDIDLSFKKLKKIAEENGRVVVSIDAHNHSFFRNLFALLPLDILHPHQYNLDEYEAFLTDNGFEIESKTLIKKEFFFDYWVLVGKKV